MDLLGIDDTLNALLNCIEAALEDSESPVCTAGTTIGLPAIASCCECGDNTEGELWGNLMRTYRSDNVSFTDATARRPCAPATWAAQFQFTLARCFPVVDERGDLPSAEERSAAAAALHADVATMRRALHCCTETETPYVEGISVTNDPEGGCSYLVATVRVPVSMKMADNPR